MTAAAHAPRFFVALFAWCALCLVAPEAARAQDAAPASEARPASAQLESPRATMRTLLVAMNELWSAPGAWERATQTLQPSGLSEVQQRERVRKLYAVLNRIALVDPQRLPDARAAASLTRYPYFPDAQRDRVLLRRIGAPLGAIVLERAADGAWRFSAETVATLPALHGQLEPLPLVAGRAAVTFGEWLEAYLPETLVRGRFLTVKYWAWLAIFVLIVLGLLADLFTRALLGGFVRRAVRRFRRTGDLAGAGVHGAGVLPPASVERVQRMLRPVGWSVAAIVWLLPVSLLELDPLLERVLGGALRVFLVLTGTLAAWRLIDLAAGALAARAARTETRMDDVLVPLFSRAFKVFVLAIGGIYAADALNIPITPLLASLTVAGVGFSFAAKDTVENFFGSVAVVLDRPFEIGDWVVMEGTEGIVEQVGFRSTRIRTFYNSQVTVPNSNLVRATVDNYGRRQYRRWQTTLALTYDTKPAQLLAFTEGVRELIRAHPYTRKDYYQVWCNEFGASSIDVLLYMFFETPDWDTELRERERLLLDILRLAEQLDVQFAFPTQTLHWATGAAPGSPGAPARSPARRADSAADSRGPSSAEGGTRSVASTSDEDALRRGASVAQALTREQPWRARKPPPVTFPRVNDTPDTPSPATNDDDAEEAKA